MTIIPPAIALMGYPGTGKTDSLATLLSAGLEVFVLGTEPGAMETLIDSCERRKISLEKLHYHQLITAAPGWDAIMDQATKVKGQNYEQLADQKSGISKDKMQHWMNFLLACKDFPDDRTGKKYGDVTTWDDSRAFVIDSLSGLNRMAREYTVGYKPTMHQGEWGVAMQLEDNIIYKLQTDRRCFFVLLAHVDREVDEVNGGTVITLAALGRKLAPQMSKNFGEIILARREENKFFWSTMDRVAVVKNRALAISNSLDPDFSPIVAAHRRRVAAIQASKTA